MKKTILMVASIATLLCATSNSTSAQAVEEGNFIIEGYYGFPNLYSAVFRSAYANSGTELNIDLGGIGPVGGRFEYLLADKVGVGIDVGFQNSTIQYDEVSTDGNGNAVTYSYDFKTQKLGIMPFVNFHFIENDNLDFYGTLGVGYGSRSFSFASTDPNYTPSTVKSPIPVASRLGIGLRYFFSDNVGANLGLGFGHGGLINAGISFKF